LGQDFEPRVPIQVIPNGVNLELFEVKQRAWEPVSLLFVGRIVYQKGLDILLLALAEFKQADWTLNLVGDGPRVFHLTNQAAELGIAERVHFLGWQSRMELPTTYQQANVFVYPSRHEGMPNAVLEAMASGLPVIATRIAGNEELVNEDCGRLVAPEDVGALKEALAEVLPNAELRQGMGSAARQRAAANYSWRSVAEEYLRLMQRIVEAG
jgi:glycosyltransferase involved in cell wall biosynthesis